MTMPPVFQRPGGTAYPVASLDIQAPPVNELAALLTMGTLPPDLRALALRAKQARDASYAHDTPRALPAGVLGALGGGLTDLLSGRLLPGMRPLLPGVAATGGRWTRMLMDRLNEIAGATPGTTATRTGEELGGLGTSAALLGLDAGRPGMPPEAELPRGQILRNAGEGEHLTATDVTGNQYTSAGRTIRGAPPRPAPRNVLAEVPIAADGAGNVLTSHGRLIPAPRGLPPMDAIGRLLPRR